MGKGGGIKNMSRALSFKIVVQYLRRDWARSEKEKLVHVADICCATKLAPVPTLVISIRDDPYCNTRSLERAVYRTTQYK